MRLFVGTFLSDAEKAKLNRFQEEFGDTARFSSKIAWVKQEKLHQTWCFLGEVDEAAAPKIVDALERALQAYRDQVACRGRQRFGDGTGMPDLAGTGMAGLNDLNVLFDRVELWPRRQDPKTLVIRPTKISAQFEDMAQSIRRTLKEFCNAEQKGKKDQFKPHVTIARFRKRTETYSSSPAASEVVRIKPVLADFDALDRLLPVELNVSRFDLVRSHLGSTRDVYECLRSFSL